MSATREAVVLPALLLTAALLGGLRVGTRVILIAPPLVSIVAGVLLVGALVRSGAVVPARLVGAARRPLENANGTVVLVTLVAASAQMFNLLTPETGLLHLLFAAFFFIQVLTLVAGTSGAGQMLRSVAVMFGCALVLRFVVLENLYAPGGGTAKRILTLLVEGASLGAIDYQAHSPATGYVALVAIVIYLFALWLLAAAHRQRSLALVPATPLMTLLLAVTLSACGGDSEGPAPVGEVKAGTTEQGTTVDRDRAMRARDDALAAARVWSRPPTAPAAYDFAANPPGADSFATDAEVTCRFVPKPVGGTTPKFNCELPGGEVVRVKYGTANAELHAEVAATRLLTALGFGADRMYAVRAVRCLGCPPFPFQALKCLDDTGLARTCFAGGLDYSQAAVFQPAVVERRYPGKKIEAIPDQGWAWFEFDRIDPARGGSPRAETDALKLVALLLAHWDNKAENQRLVCLPGGERPDGTCTKPFALIQDLGGTFGPYKVDLASWQRTHIWADRRGCRVSMKALPWGGGTFTDGQISEEGRRFALELLGQLGDEQLRDLFTASGITSYDQVTAVGRDAGLWVQAFRAKVEEIRNAGPCPGVS